MPARGGSGRRDLGRLAGRLLVAVLADGNTRLTAFLPTDRAFQRLVKDLTGKKFGVPAVKRPGVRGVCVDIDPTAMAETEFPRTRGTDDRGWTEPPRWCRAAATACGRS